MSDTTITPEHTEDTPNERRALLRKLAIGGASAAAGAVLLNHGTASAAPANLQTEDTNATVAPTIIDYNGAAITQGPSVFSAGGYEPPADSPFPAGVGGYGDATIPNGVHGSTTAAAGFGVVAANLAPAAAAATDPVPTGLAVASLGGAQMRFVPLDGAVSGPTPGKHLAGELYVDKDGTLWFTVPTATAGVVRFVKLAGTPTSGSYNAIAPQRAYDSRQPDYAVKGLLAPNTSRVVSVADGHDSRGTVTLKDAVPAGATAVHINVTAVDTTGPNYLAVTAGDTASTETSLLNWIPANHVIANAVTVPVDADRKIKVFCGNQAGSTQFIIDVFGYYL